MPDAEILLFPLKEPADMVCPCGNQEFRLTDDWKVWCWGCGLLVGFWNQLQPE